jgi:phosphatidylserine/phosphatidylglycerophosphate/cardiolipin synthase-like enzyme
MVLLMAACANDRPDALPTPQNQPGRIANGDIQVYFTNPEGSKSCTLTKPMLSAVNDARESIDLALYNINQEDFAEALIDAHIRGVMVRMVLDNEKAFHKVPQELIDAGIPIVIDPDTSTMHNKFMIIDGQQVWTGSMNFTESGCEDDYNNMLQIQNETLAKNYQTEFNEMAQAHSFSANSPADTPYPRMDISGVPVETYFSPDDGVQEAMLKVIAQADSSIVFMAYSFTSDELADALIERYKKGVQVQGVMDEDQIQSNTGGEYENFLRAGIPVTQDDIPGQMHNKVMIINGEIVITGSYNFSKNAEKRNDENVLVIHSRDIAEVYLQAYQEISPK